MKFKNGFTLIELLVVIFIILVLLGFVVSAYYIVRNSSDKSYCANNLRQIGAALELYALNNDGKYPPPGSLIPTPTFWSLKLYPTYLDDNNIFDCPVWDRPTWGFPPTIKGSASYPDYGYFQPAPTAPSTTVVITDIYHGGSITLYKGGLVKVR